MTKQQVFHPLSEQTSRKKLSNKRGIGRGGYKGLNRAGTERRQHSGGSDNRIVAGRCSVYLK